jgi:dTMP kinase
MVAQSLLISFEGIDGSGKSTQVRSLSRHLRNQGYSVLMVAEPGTTPLGRRLRGLLKSAKIPMSPLAEGLLFSAARAQLAEEVIRPALAQGKVVISDRYSDSTLAYQGFGRGLDLVTLRWLNTFATSGLRPRLTVLMDLPMEEAIRRRGPRPQDRFEGERFIGSSETPFLLRVRQGFLALAKEEKQRWLVVDATLTRHEAHRVIREEVGSLLDKGS